MSCTVGQVSFVLHDTSKPNAVGAHSDHTQNNAVSRYLLGQPQPSFDPDFVTNLSYYVGKSVLATKIPREKLLSLTKIPREKV